MVPFGRVSPLPIVSVDEKGCFLRYDEESGASAFIPRSQMPEGAGVGSFVNALVYLDDGRVTLTAKRPRVEAGGLAALEVKGAGRFGYFLDNGIPKELFLPFSDSVSEHEIGDTVLVYCRLDHENRMCATEYFEKFFRTKAPASFHEGDRVRLFPYARTRLGVKCVADLRFTALMHSGSVPEGLRPGKKLWGIISRIRADGLTDVIPAASGPARDEAQPLQGGSPEQCFTAAGFAIQNLLGLVCDPIAGLVEAPCQARNAVGASNALVSAELALAGIRGAVPFDEVVDAMRQVGHSLPESLRETALGGIAATPAACSLAEKIGCHGCG